MMQSSNVAPPKLEPGDEVVFDKLAEAARQFEEYLAITQSAAVIAPDESVIPPPTDLPLSLTFRRDAD